jgi:hypothetical protein
MAFRLSFIRTEDMDCFSFFTGAYCLRLLLQGLSGKAGEAEGI